MKTFDVLITETLEKVVSVEAENVEKAAEIVSDKYHNSEYILDADCFTDVKFVAKKNQRNRDYER